MIAKLVASVLLLISSALAQPSQPSSADAVYIALGDSVAAGIGSSLPRDHAYATLIGELFSVQLGSPVRTLNLAESGESAASFLSGEQITAFEAAVVELDAAGIRLQTVTLTLGGNDVLDVRNASIAEREEALESFAASMPTAVQTIKDVVGPDVPVYVSTLYDPTGEDPEVAFTDAWWIARFNEVIREAVASADAELVDLAASLGAEAQDLTRFPADVHPTNAGHIRIAAEFWRVIGLDRQAPELVLHSNFEVNRYTPTLRFSLGQDADPRTLQIRVADPQIVVYPPVKVAEHEYVQLIDASETQPAALPITLSVADGAGNLTEVETELVFTLSP